MNDALMAVMTVAIVAFFVMMLLCIKKEKKLIGFYSAIGVCGRWYASITADFLLLGIGAPVVSAVAIMAKLFGGLKDVPLGAMLAIALSAVIFLPLGLLMLRNAQKKCPESLRKRLPLDMVIILLGTSFRLGLFFLAFIFHMWFKAHEPRYYEVNGKTYYAYPGSDKLYAPGGFEAGRLVDNDHAIMNH